MEIIPAVAGNKSLVINAEFVKLTIYNNVNDAGDVTIYTFSSAYKAETIDGQVYSPLGGLLSVGVQQRDIRVTSADTSVSLAGIPSDNIYAVLDTEGKIRGSKLQIIRGFYDDNYNLSNYAPRFTGIITSYNISEDLDNTDDIDNFTVTLNASSFKQVLENRIAGRKTNKQSWQYYNSTDSSMNNVYSISDQDFDFGKAPLKKAATNSAASQENMSTNQSYDVTTYGAP
jgi:hypothetical protein